MWWKGFLFLGGAILLLYFSKPNKNTGPRSPVIINGLSKVIFKIIFALLLVFFLFLWYKHIEAKERLLVEIKTTRTITPKEEWFFTWILPPGEYDNNRNSHTLSLEITLDNDAEFRAIMYDNSQGRNLKVGGLRLNKKGNNLIGTWSNYLNDNGGDCYLYYAKDGIWTGHYTHKDKTRTDIKMERR